MPINPGERHPKPTKSAVARGAVSDSIPVIVAWTLAGAILLAFAVPPAGSIVAAATFAVGYAYGRHR